MLRADRHQSLEGTHHSGSDEYSDDDDPGYTRQDIRGQEAFISRELDLSDDEGSHRGPLSFQSPSPLIKPSSSNGQASSYMAEPPGTSVQDSEAPSDMSHSTIHQPDRSSSNAVQPFNLTLRPDPNILGSSEVNANAEAVQGTSRTDHSSASSASFTGTDKSRRDVADEAPASELASNAGAEAPSEGQIQASIVHQTSGIRYLLDGVLEKVSDAFSRHQPRGTPRPSHTSDTSGDQEEYDEQDRGDHDGTRLPGRNSYSQARHVAWTQTVQLYMPLLQSASHPVYTCGSCIIVMNLCTADSFFVCHSLLTITEQLFVNMTMYRKSYHTFSAAIALCQCALPLLQPSIRDARQSAELFG